MQIKRIMLCLDGSKHSIRGINTAISFAKQTDSTIVGVHSVTKFGSFTAVHLSKIPRTIAKANKLSFQHQYL